MLSARAKIMVPSNLLREPNQCMIKFLRRDYSPARAKSLFNQNPPAIVWSNFSCENALRESQIIIKSNSPARSPARPTSLYKQILLRDCSPREPNHCAIKIDQTSPARLHSARDKLLLDQNLLQEHSPARTNSWYNQILLRECSPREPNHCAIKNSPARLLSARAKFC